MLFLVVITLGSLSLETTANGALSRCHQEISGIYLRRYVDGKGVPGDYGLTFFFPLGGVLQFDSAAKQNKSAYYSDMTGFYTCRKFRRSWRRRLSFTGFIYLARKGENITLNLLESSINCRGVADDCSDNAVRCSRGRLQTQSYPLSLPNANTGNFEQSIPNTLVTRRFESQRILTHATVTGGYRDRCYFNMSGIYISRHEDDNYHITAYTSLGYAISFSSKDRRADGTYQRGTYIGTWHCTVQRSVSGQYYYFTYANKTNEQTIVSGTYYEQCTSETYPRCSGEAIDLPFPLQYQSPPFRNGQLKNSTVSKYTSHLLAKAPTIKACHLSLAGTYVFEATMSGNPEKIASAANLYRNGIFFNGLLSVDGSRGSALGVWDCDANGHLSMRRIAIGTSGPNSNSGFRFFDMKTELRCDKDGHDCVGYNAAFSTSALVLPINGEFPSLAFAFNTSLVGRKLRAVTGSVSN